MSNELAPFQRAIVEAKERFLAQAGDVRAFDREAVFAMQLIAKNDFAISTANRNPTSVRLAMLNVAATGLTLNPANAYAYLVPRDGAIVLDISYKGLIKIATDGGSIEWVRADVVHEGDSFVYNGPAAAPTHSANAFGDRGEIVGVYCIAKTTSGDYLCETMGRDELEKIRSKSTAFEKKKSGPWVEWFAQMCKKAVIKRASKTWPYGDSAAIARLDRAIEIANEGEGGYTLEQSDEAKAHARQQQHDAALGRNFSQVQAIKDELAKADPDAWAVREAWSEICEADQIALWLAPSKGGIFTTREREQIRANATAQEPAA